MNIARKHLFRDRAIATEVNILALSLQAAVLAIDVTPNLLDALALLDHLRRIQRLSLTDVHSRGGVAIDKA